MNWKNMTEASRPVTCFRSLFLMLLHARRKARKMPAMPRAQETTPYGGQEEREGGREGGKG